MTIEVIFITLILMTIALCMGLLLGFEFANWGWRKHAETGFWMESNGQMYSVKLENDNTRPMRIVYVDDEGDSYQSDR